MTTNGDKQSTDHGPARRCGLGRRARLAVGAVVLIGIGMVGGALIASSVDAAAHGGFRLHHYGQNMSLDLQKRHARHAAEWFADEVAATPEQKEQIDSIAEALTDQLYPLQSAHRANKQALLGALSGPAVDREALEQLRLAELGLAESASQHVTEAIGDLAEVLTVEQRAALIERFADGHH